MSQAFDPFAGFELSHTAPSTRPQQEIWLAIKQGGLEASLAYNECLSLEISGPVDEALLREAWELLARRHESLRTCFTQDGQTLCIEKVPRITWRTEDWSGEDHYSQRKRLSQLLGREVASPFHLVTQSGFRVTWVDFGEERSEFILTAHHILCDGYSAGVLLSELCQVYTALSEGRAPALETAPKFSDYALAQKEALGSPESAEAERQWLKLLGESPETLDLPVDSQRPINRSFEARREDILLPRELLEGLRATAGRAGISLTAAFLAAFTVFLSRLSGQREFVIGMPSAGQAMSGFSGLVGHCVNTLPLPVRIESEASFIDYARTVKSVILDGLENQILSFGELLQKLKLPRDPSRIPLLPVLVNLDPPMKLGRLGGAEVRFVSHPRSYEAFEIFLNGNQTEEGLVLETTYNTSLFRRESILLWMGDFEELLRGIIEDPTCRVGDLPLLSSQSRALLQVWNLNDRPLPPQASALALFEAQAARTPNALAVRDSRSSLSYRELDCRANHLARRLVELGVVAESIVGLSVGRSAQMLAALLAVWKAGAAYLPLDPDFPEERLGFIAKDSGIQILITETPYLGLFEGQGMKQLILDKEEGSAAQGPTGGGSPESLAYVLYTSGSTGAPKGVQIEHRSLANFLTSMATDLAMTDRDILVAVTTLSFDIAGLELFLPISLGAQSVIASRDDTLDAHRLAGLLASCSASILQATPATWQLLVETDWMGAPGFKALCGGEALPMDLEQKLADRVSQLWNVYGPTETTIWSTLDQIHDLDEPISIGKPIANTSLHIVDARLRKLPIGAAGELLIGGAGVARGYLNRPELTAEKFLPDPFSAKPGARLYRTGDICRFGLDGRVYFLGRNDSQVKVRGFRIELGEIEAALAAIDGIQAAAAAAKEFGPGDLRVVAYFVAEEGSPPDVAALKEALGRRLPRYMLPAYLIPLPRLPLTPNGKLDRKALPLPSEEWKGRADNAEASSPIQKQLLSIWRELLRVNRIGIKDSFFDLGGHSLLAARMLSRISQELGVEIPLRVIFQAQDIESLALKVESFQLAAPRADDPLRPVEILDF